MASEELQTATNTPSTPSRNGRSARVDRASSSGTSTRFSNSLRQLRPNSRSVRPLRREGAVIFQHQTPGISLGKPHVNADVNTAEGQTNAAHNTPQGSGIGLGAPFLDVFEQAFSGVRNTYITSRHSYHHAIVHIGLRPAASRLPSDIWFAEKPLSNTSVMERGSKVYHELDILEDVKVPVFRLDQSHVSLWTCVDSWTSSGGLTAEEFERLCVRCSECHRYMDRRSRYFHSCPQALLDASVPRPPTLPLPQSSLNVVGYPLRQAMELCHRFHCGTGEKLGISSEEAQYLFVTCFDCGKVMTRYAAWYHSHYDAVEHALE